MKPNMDLDTVQQTVNIGSQLMQVYFERAADLDVPPYQALGLLSALIRDQVLRNLRDPETSFDMNDLRAGREIIKWMRENLDTTTFLMDSEANRLSPRKEHL